MMNTTGFPSTAQTSIRQSAPTGSEPSAHVTIPKRPRAIKDGAFGGQEAEGVRYMFSGNVQSKMSSLSAEK